MARFLEAQDEKEHNMSALDFRLSWNLRWGQKKALVQFCNDEIYQDVAADT
jgi:hypothetical protein